MAHRIDPTIKATILIEALPYIKRFHHHYVVVKLSGKPIENPAILDNFYSIWCG